MSEPRIRRLERDLVNKIAAGEVVERPASVVKELVENSIDAESSRIEITLEEGGRKLIKVMDDGTGMEPADLALAFESHTTSKLRDVDGLFSIDTLGFRGEALASIASVSRCRAVSRPRGAAEAASVEISAGKMGAMRSCGAPEGTLIEVRDLFFHTPARLKFLRSTSTELRHVIEMVSRLALPHPAIAFTLIHNDKVALKLHPCTSFHQRLDELFPGCERLLPVRSESSALTVNGYISPPGEGESAARQYVFLNGRYIRDRAIQRAITEAYRTRMLRGKFPAVFLSMQIEASRVDVNVHPTKVEVRFRDSGAVFAQTLTALEKALHGSASAGEEAATVAPSQQRENIRRAITEFIQHPPRQPMPPPVSRNLNFPVRNEPAQRPVETAVAPMPPLPKEVPAPTPGAVGAAPAAIRNFVQVLDSYIVEESHDGFKVIDQHALHERILYEELARRAANNASVPRQKLLIPEIVDLRPGEFLRAMESRDALLKLGLEVESFGEKTVAIHAVPHLASKVHPRELLLEVLQEDNQEASQGAPREQRLMYIIACKAAVKAGERLSRAQIEALLVRRDEIGPEPTCPHGRPTTLFFSKNELEKQFRRK